VAHFDLKSPNILISSMNPNDYVVAKVSDFGNSQFIHNEPITVRYVDNPRWLAPEILDNQPYDERVDTYAYGWICWEILTRCSRRDS